MKLPALYLTFEACIVKHLRGSRAGMSLETWCGRQVDGDTTTTTQSFLPDETCESCERAIAKAFDE
jgi:hypothetical protein